MVSKHSTIPSTITSYLDSLASRDDNKLDEFHHWLDEHYPISNGHSPNGHLKPPRLLSPLPTHHPSISIYERLSSKPELYSISVEDKQSGVATTMSVSALPKYLVLCARRLDAQLPNPTGWHPVFRCAIESGIEQIRNDVNVSRLIKLKKESYTVSPGAMLSNEIDNLNSSIKFEPPAPNGVFHPPKKLLLLDQVHARMSSLADGLGMKKSLLIITCVVFGFLNQRELQQDTRDPHDHSRIISDHVATFDALVRVRVEMAQILNELSRSIEARRRSAEKARGRHLHSRQRRKYPYN